jgi:ferrous iron transport protein B
MGGCAGCQGCDINFTGNCPGPLSEKGPDAYEGCGVVLVGNSKVGKSTLFHKLCQKRIENEQVRSLKRKVERGFAGRTKTLVYNTPGLLSMFSKNMEERVARDILLPGVIDEKIGRIVIVADSKNLKRSISLALQFSEYELPMLLVLNMADEAKAKGIRINRDKLSSVLGIPVCETVARNGEGIEDVLFSLEAMERPHSQTSHSEDVESFIETVKAVLEPKGISSRALALHILTHDPGVRRYVRNTFGNEKAHEIYAMADSLSGHHPEPFGLRAVRLYTKKAEEIVRVVQSHGVPDYRRMSAKIGQLCMTPLTGIPIAAAVLYLLYRFVGTLGAGYLVDLINVKIFGEHLIPWLTRIVAPIPFPILKDMLVDPDFGIFPTGVFLALGLVTPVLFCFYIAFGVLEDSGYLSRLAVLLDRVFQKMGFNGKGIIPLTMGFSCVTMAILTTRVLDTEKEKNIMCFLLLLGLPCAPLLAVMLVILGDMALSATFMVFGLIFFQLIVAGYFSNKVLFGARSPLIMEIQPVRFPRLAQVLSQATAKTVHFIKEALPVFVLASMFVFFFERLGGLDYLEKLMRPVVCSFMGLPEKSVQVFIKTLIRRENGATEIMHLSKIYDHVQLVVNLLVMTFLSPCINATLVLIKERGLRTAASILFSVMLYALFIGGVINHACRYFGITFT